MEIMAKTQEAINEKSASAWTHVEGSLRKAIRSKAGQGTTEYAILVGVLVVIAILAIMVFRPRLEELWSAIADGINGL